MVAFLSIEEEFIALCWDIKLIYPVFLIESSPSETLSNYQFSKTMTEPFLNWLMLLWYPARSYLYSNHTSNIAWSRECVRVSPRFSITEASLLHLAPDFFLIRWFSLGLWYLLTFRCEKANCLMSWFCCYLESLYEIFLCHFVDFCQNGVATFKNF